MALAVASHSHPAHARLFQLPFHIGITRAYEAHQVICEYRDLLAMGDGQSPLRSCYGLLVAHLLGKQAHRPSLYTATRLPLVRTVSLTML